MNAVVGIGSAWLLKFTWAVLLSDDGPAAELALASTPLALSESLPEKDTENAPDGVTLIKCDEVKVVVGNASTVPVHAFRANDRAPFTVAGDHKSRRRRRFALEHHTGRMASLTSVLVLRHRLCAGSTVTIYDSAISESRHKASCTFYQNVWLIRRIDTHPHLGSRNQWAGAIVAA